MKNVLLVLVVILCIILGTYGVIAIVAGDLRSYTQMGSRAYNNNADNKASLTASEQKKAVAALTQTQTLDVDQVNAPYAGNPHGDVKIVVYSDYKCPVCQSLDTLLIQLLKDDKNTEVVYYDLPILSPLSLVGARYALAVYLTDPRMYLIFHDALMRSGYRSEQNVVDLVQSLGMNVNVVSSYAYSDQVVSMLQMNRAHDYHAVPVIMINDQQVRIPAAFSTLQMQVANARAQIR